jgi:hypothetical protein
MFKLTHKTPKIVFIMNRENKRYREDLSTCLTYTGFQNKLETPKTKDKVNKREVHECDGRVHVIQT